jgi:hypothetical protein
MSTVELAADRKSRHRAAAAPVWPPRLPGDLDVDERALLRDWLQGSAASRPWLSLLKTAGFDRIDLAARLVDKALAAGLCTLKEQRELGKDWQKQTLIWVELAALQREFGLTTRDDRTARLQALTARLDVLMGDELVGEAAQALAESRMPIQSAESRAMLLGALQTWVAAERDGLRRDFSLHVDHTKVIRDGEWTWLERHFDLPALGIGPFAPTLTLAGDFRLHWDSDRRVDLGVLGFATLPVDALRRLAGLTTAPSRWWLIEGRASFEKQAARLASGDLLVWIAGRPTRAWKAAVTSLLQLAPAPAAVSADADPAGIEIVLAASEPWEASGLAWTATAMEPERLDRPGAQPLGTYDRGVLARLAGRELPPELAALRDALAERGMKAEQEGWL